MSAYGVDGRIDVAKCHAGPPLRLPPTPMDTRKAATAASAAGGTREPRTPQDPWAQLVRYHRDCVVASTTTVPLFTAREEGTKYVCLGGRERLLSGDIDLTGSIPLPANAAELAERAGKDDVDLWCGYPAVALFSAPGGAARRVPEVAPLLIRRVEIARDDTGIRLEPYGPILLHPRLTRRFATDEDATDLATTWRPEWPAGAHQQMGSQIRLLLRDEFGLDCVEELRPDDLAAQVNTQLASDGARNSAMLFLAPRDEQMSKRLVKDLDDLLRKKPDIARTALGALLDGSGDANIQPPGRTPVIVAPLRLNDAQRNIIQATWTRRLTVATGPPGTGKSQLVANLVATAVANKQSVLVASTNNQAVNEVWQRCERLVPGALVRTGSRGPERDYTEVERATLHQLVATGPPAVSLATASAELRSRDGAHQVVRRELATKATAEADLYRLGEARRRYAGLLNLAPAGLSALLRAEDGLSELTSRARRAARARFLGRWRRARLLRRAGVSGEPSRELCIALAEYATAEKDWRAARRTVSAVRGDDALATAWEQTSEQTEGAAAQMLDTVVRHAAHSGRQVILGLLQAAQSDRSDWHARRLILSHVHGWALTSMTARTFPPDAGLFDLVIIDEASQCPIPHILPLLFRAKRALIIGDAMQLPHIAGITREAEEHIRAATGLHPGWLEDRRLSYRRHSAFHACARATGGSLLLDEHYRCHPAIIAVPNQLFYSGKLTVLTDVRRQRRIDRPAVTWADIAGKAVRHHSGRSWINTAEADHVQRCVDYLLKRLPPDGTVGVITPFREQQALLKRRFPDDDRVRVGTVHTFQGGERDAMVFSLVATKDMNSNAVSWLSRELNLWNVAITRARSHLIVVGDKSFWKERDGIGSALLAAATTALPETTSVPDSTDPLLFTLYQELTARPHEKVDLLVPLDGYVADAVVSAEDGATAMLLDRGCADADPARHLHLQLTRRALLTNPELKRRAARVPAWWLFDDEEPLRRLAM